MKRIRSGRIELALHTLRDEPGPTLLLLHELAGSARELGDVASHWPGRVFAVDLAGHGESDRPRGASYAPELLASDADAALRELGEARVAGFGLGAYLALLLAAARPERVPAAYLLPGRGLDGGGEEPNYASPVEDLHARVGTYLDAAAERDGAPFDPMVFLCETDVRPSDYVRSHAEAARRLLLAEDGSPRPAWWESIRETPCSEPAPADLAAGFAQLRRDPAS